MKKEIDWLLKEKYHNKIVKNFYKDIERLKKGEPTGYVIGFTEFLGCKIDLSKKPLIPRIETEFWTKKAIEIMLKNLPHGLVKILDIFSGSGCIGISILSALGGKNCKVDFVDSEKKCLEQININCKINKINPKRYKIIRSYIFSKISPGEKYNFIFANPPYIAKKNKSKIQKSVLKFEPKKALFGGDDGFYFIKKFLKKAGDYLNKKGVIFMEFDSAQKKEIEKIIIKNKYKSYQFFKDQYNRWRWLSIEK